MTTREATPVPAAEVQKRFDYYRDEAVKGPVLISKDGRTKTVMLSYEAFTRPRQHQRRAYDLDDLPADLVATILEIDVPDDPDAPH